MRKKNNHGNLRCKGTGCGRNIHLTDGKPLRKKKSIKCQSCNYSNTVTRKKNNGKIILI